MSPAEVPSSLRNIIADALEISPDQVTGELNASMVENWDSWRHLQMILAIEEEYSVQLDPQRMHLLSDVSMLQAELEKMGVKL